MIQGNKLNTAHIVKNDILYVKQALCGLIGDLVVLHVFYHHSIRRVQATINLVHVLEDTWQMLLYKLHGSGGLVHGCYKMFKLIHN